MTQFTLQLHNPLESFVYLPGPKIADNSAPIHLHVGPPDEVLSCDLLLQLSLVLLKSHLFFDVSLQLCLTVTTPFLASCRFLSVLLAGQRALPCEGP